MEKPYSLMTPEELAEILRGKDTCYDRIIIIDARMEHHFQSVHIMGAVNVVTKLDAQHLHGQYLGQNVALVFYGDLDGDQGAKLAMDFRALDREQNANDYPKVSYNNLFVLRGGIDRVLRDYPELLIKGTF